MSVHFCSDCNTVLRSGFNFCPGCRRPCSEEGREKQRRSAGDSSALVNPQRIGIRADVLVAILADLDQNPDLTRVFQGSVLSSIVVVSDENDLRIEDAGVCELEKEESDLFLEVLGQVIDKHAS